MGFVIFRDTKLQNDYYLLHIISILTNIFLLKRAKIYPFCYLFLLQFQLNWCYCFAMAIQSDHPCEVVHLFLVYGKL